MSSSSVSVEMLKELIGELKQIAREAASSEIDPTFYALLDRREKVYERLTGLGSEATDALIGLLVERDSMVSLFAAEALGRRKAVAAVKPLLEAFVAEANPVFTIAIAQIGDLSAVDPLIAILENADFLAEEYAEQIRLRGLYAERNPLRAWTGNTLHRLGVVKADVQVRDATALLLRRSAAAALGELGDARALAQLRLWASHPEPTLRQTVLQAIEILETR